MRDKKRAQSEIITTVLIILLVLAAIIIVWNVVKRTVVTGTEGIGISALTTNLEIEDVKIYISGDAKIKVKRGSGAGDITSLKFVFKEKDEESVVIERKEEDGYEMPEELETKIYNVSYNEIKADKKIEKVSVVPMFETRAGIEASVSESKIEEVNNEGVYYSNLIHNWDMETDEEWLDTPEQVLVSDINEIEHYAHRSDETGTSCYNWAYPALIPANPNKAYKFSIWIKSDDPTMNNYFGFHIFDSSVALIAGDWNNPYFTGSEGPNEWRKWEGYLGPISAGAATNCDSAETNGDDWCMAGNTAYIAMRFGSCYGDGGSNGHTWFMYPKIEEIEW